MSGWERPPKPRYDDSIGLTGRKGIGKRLWWGFTGHTAGSAALPVRPIESSYRGFGGRSHPDIGGKLSGSMDWEQSHCRVCCPIVVYWSPEKMWSFSFKITLCSIPSWQITQKRSRVCRYSPDRTARKNLGYFRKNTVSVIWCKNGLSATNAWTILERLYFLIWNYSGHP